MGIAEMLEGLALVRQNSARSSFVGPRHIELVEAAEAAIGWRLPPTYRMFASRLGAGSFGSAEFYGVTTDDFEHGRVPNGISLTLSCRRQRLLPGHYLIVASLGGSSFCCLRRTDGAESPVFLVEAGAALAAPGASAARVVADDFGTFFLERVRSRLQVVQPPLPKRRILPAAG